MVYNFFFNKQKLTHIDYIQKTFSTSSEKKSDLGQ